MSDHRRDAIHTFEEVTKEVRSAFGGLTADQLNRKPAADSWSAAQCLDHLITINSLYFPLFESLRTGPVPPSLWERCSPLSGIFGRLLIKSLSPDAARKTRTSRKAEPSSSRIDHGIIDRFALHQEALIQRVRDISPGVDLETTIVTSPLLGLITYSLADCLTLLAVHEQRHLAQARRALG